MSSSNDYVENLIAEWIHAGCQGSLLDLVNQQIEDSRLKIRRKLQELPNRRKVLQDLNDSRESAEHLLIESSELLKRANDLYDGIDGKLLPVLNSLKNDLKQQLASVEEFNRMTKDFEITSDDGLGLNNGGIDGWEDYDMDDVEVEDDASQKQDDADDELVQNEIQEEQNPSEEIPDDPVTPPKPVDGILLLNAREIIKRDMMSEILTVGSEKEASDEDVIQYSFHQLPVMKISKNCLIFSDFMMQILTDAELDSSQERRIILYTTVRKSIDMYGIITRVVHQKMIQETSTGSAVFFNNCQFLVHFLKNSPQVKEASDDDETSDFYSLIPVIEKEAEDVMAYQIFEQKTRIRELLQDPKVVSCLINNASGSDLKIFEESVNRCLYLLNKTFENWKPILSKDHLNHFMGDLISELLDEMITRILSIEDISKNSTENLFFVMTLVKTEVIKFLIIKDKRHQENQFLNLVKSAFMFDELKICLLSSLKEIIDRWESGPTSGVFRPDQMRHLIRALFKNSEIRSAALNRIK